MMEAFDCLADLDNVSLGDARLNQRAQGVVARLSSSPAVSLPVLFPDESELTALYRLTSHAQLDEQRLLRPHIEGTVQRAAAAGDVLVLHDTTEFAFAAPGGKVTREHLAKLSSKRQGFHAHVSLAVSDQAVSMPLGILHLQPYAHLSQLGDSAARWWAGRNGIFDNEHDRWPEACRITEDRLADTNVRPIHVCDREGDSNAMLLDLTSAGSRFVIRCSSQHRVVEEEAVGRTTAGKATTNAKAAEGEPRVVLVREQRTGEKPAPDAPRRRAAIQVRYRAVTLTGANKSRVTLWLVDVHEPDPPEGFEPVRWLLYTTEPTETDAQAWQCVDRYRCRWLIEEWFKAMKTGVSYESRQFESAHALLNFLALATYIASQMLMLRALHRVMPEANAAEILRAEALEVLQKFVPKAKLHAASTIGAVLAAIAGWGGHQKSNGPPGWLTLWRGYARLLQTLEVMRVLGEYPRAPNALGGAPE